MGQSFRHRTLKSVFERANKGSQHHSYGGFPIASEGTVKINFKYIASPDHLCSTRWYITLEPLDIFSAVGMPAKWLNEENPGLSAGYFFVEAWSTFTRQKYC